MSIVIRHGYVDSRVPHRVLEAGDGKTGKEAIEWYLAMGRVRERPEDGRDP